MDAGIVLGVVPLAVAGLGFAFTAAVSGEFNYQGGDRRTFYGSFPFDGPDDVWNRPANQATTNGNIQVEVLTSREWPGPIRTQRRVLPRRPPLRIHPLLLSWRRGDPARG